jgi:hypothetical protein
VQCPARGFGEHGDYPSGSIKAGNFLISWANKFSGNHEISYVFKVIILFGVKYS